MSAPSLRVMTSLAADVEAVPEPAAAPEDADTVLQAVDAVADGADDLAESADALPEGGWAVAEGGEPIPVDMTTPPAADAPEDGPGENASGQSVSPQASDARAEPAKSAEMIVVWRPDHRKTAPRREREARHSRSEGPGRSDAQGQTPVATPSWRRDKAAPPPARPNRPNSAPHRRKTSPAAQRL